MPETHGKKQEATVRDFLNVIFRRKFLILSVVLVTTVFVIYLKVSQPQSYAATARILVKRGERANLYTGYVRYLTWAEEVSSQIEVILSETVFAHAREIFADSLAARGLPDVITFNPGSVRADVVGESNVFVIAYSGYNPDECVLGCVAVTEAYKEFYKKRSAPPKVTEYFDKEIEEAVAAVERWKKARSAFLHDQNYLGRDEERRHQASNLAHIQRSLADVNSDLSSQALRVEALLELIELDAEELEGRLALGGRGNNLQDAIMANIKRDIQTLQMDREELLHKYTDRHPEVIAIDKQVVSLQQDLKDEVENAYEAELTRYDEIKARQTSLEKDVTRIESMIDAIPNKEVGLSRIENEIEAAQLKYELLVKKQHEADVAVASSTEWEVTVLTAATRAWPSKTKDAVRMALGPILSLIIGIGVAFFYESMDHSVKNAAEVEQYLGAATLATFSEFRK